MICFSSTSPSPLLTVPVPARTRRSLTPSHAGMKIYLFEKSHRNSARPLQMRTSLRGDSERALASFHPALQVAGLTHVHCTCKSWSKIWFVEKKFIRLACRPRQAYIRPTYTKITCLQQIEIFISTHCKPCVENHTNQLMGLSIAFWTKNRCASHMPSSYRLFYAFTSERLALLQKNDRKKRCKTLYLLHMTYTYI